MKAITYFKYGPPELLEMKEIEKPTPGDNEVLIKVHASSINFSDWGMLKGEPFMVRFWSGLLKPRNPILGGDVAGRVEAVGKKVTLFKPGDEVCGDLSDHGRGGYAEYVSASEELLILKPANSSFEEAAAVPLAAVTALQGIRAGRQIQEGQKVLVNGASGGVGTFSLQIAKSLGAEVTAVCSSRHLDMVRSLGADHVIDYTQEDFTKKGQQYDHIFAVNGYHPILDYKGALSPQGNYVCIGGSGAQLFQSMALGPLISKKKGKLLSNMGVAKQSKEDLTFLKKLIEAGKVKPVIDKVYPLNDIAEAFRSFGDGHTQGKIIIKVV